VHHLAVDSLSDYGYLCESGIDDQVLPSNRDRLIRRKKQHRIGNMLRLDWKLQTLQVYKLCRIRGAEPKRPLPLGQDWPREHRVDTDVIATQFTRERTGNATDSGLRCRIANQIRAPAQPRNRPHVDNRPTTGSRHRRGQPAESRTHDVSGLS
jgi:hypothetical protein